MNKSKKRVLSLIPIVSISMTSTLNTYSMINYNLLEDNNVNLSAIKDDEFKDEFKIEGLDEVEIKNFGYSAEVNKVLSKIEFLLNNYSVNKNTAYLKKSIELFGDIGALAKEEDLKYFEDVESTVYKFFYNIRENIYDVNKLMEDKVYKIFINLNENIENIARNIIDKDKDINNECDMLREYNDIFNEYYNEKNYINQLSKCIREIIKE